MESYEPAWPKRAAAAFVALFVLLFVLTVRLPHSWLPQPAELLAYPFDRLAAFTASGILHQPFDGRDQSDSVGMLAHVLNLAAMCALLFMPAAVFLKRPPVSRFIRRWLPVFCAFVLSWQLLHYGFNKVFKWQFYRPEPNIQYSRIVDLERDILYWSTMGTSRGYNIFVGTLELVAAALLLFRRTRLVGALLATGILINVLAVNFAFGITVKLLSGFLLLLALITIWTDRSRLGALSGSAVRKLTFHNRSRTWVILKALVIAILLADAAFPYVVSGNFNDDVEKRPTLHGAWGIADSSPRKQGWQRAFVHRQGYLIFQDTGDRFLDFQLTTDTANRIMWISRQADSLEYGLDYQLRNGLLRIRGKIGMDSLDLTLVRLPLRY